MPAYGPEPETRGARRQVMLAAAVMLLALSMQYLSPAAQQRIGLALQGTVLRPFIATQESLTRTRVRAGEVERLQAQLDSITEVTATQSALVDENRTLRGLLGLSRRAGPELLPATVLRIGTPGSESTFLVDVGTKDGVREGAPVLSVHGLVGRIREARDHTSVAMDWTHPDFRVSAMLADGSAFGIVENVAGAFREADRLVLNGTPYHEGVPEGELVVTSGMGGIFPRGVPVGTIEATADVQGQWLKSYWLKPAVEPASVTHVLVETAAGPPDLSSLWASDSASAGADGAVRGPGS